jgi:hypothetical protein
MISNELLFLEGVGAILCGTVSITALVIWLKRTFAS